jgi:hypothetical protein
MQPVALAEAVDRVRPVLPDASDHVARHADIERAVPAV